MATVVYIHMWLGTTVNIYQFYYIENCLKKLLQRRTKSTFHYRLLTRIYVEHCT